MKVLVIGNYGVNTLLGTIVPATNHSLYKKQPNSNLTEAKAYQEIMKDKSLVGLTPIFYKEINHKNECKGIAKNIHPYNPYV